VCIIGLIKGRTDGDGEIGKYRDALTLHQVSQEGVRSFQVLYLTVMGTSKERLVEWREGLMNERLRLRRERDRKCGGEIGKYWDILTFHEVDEEGVRSFQVLYLTGRGTSKERLVEWREGLMNE
jgi:hypothetical protein